ncbi:MAG: 1-(5-phosphoribosyl)-5-[(5-phosphoribosylamino)methylideneamino]imidazole-4-carboxamide isomerase, partial [Bacteroidaceae bacterium]|nr:1-(5-phosphoribosyl)-5-[(5-phosphoribosylamino)methylideneamino]imidazole-4-carboxamide isomerase [Bacteroidaceae bacterium]
RGIRRVLCTDISRDGMLQGTATDLYRHIMTQFPDLQLIASGGVSCEQDIDELHKAGIPAVVFGKAIYEGKVNLKDLAHKYITR